MSAISKAAPIAVESTPQGGARQPAPVGVLARYPAIGLGLLLLGGLVFAALAVNVRTNGPLLAWDLPIDQALHARATHDFFVTFALMRFSGFVGHELAVAIMIVLGLIWLWKRNWQSLSMVLLGVLGGNIWFEVLSGFFGRHRPVWADPLDPLPGPGFPSGHSMTSVLLFGLILLLLLPHLSSWRWRLLAAVDALLIALLIGFSRLYMGAHYPTDVLGGYSFGLAWGALVYTGIPLIQRWRSATRKKEPGAHTGRPLQISGDASHS